MQLLREMLRNKPQRHIRLRFSQMLHQLRLSKLNQLLKHRNLLLKKLNLRPLKSRRQKRSKRKVPNSQMEKPHKVPLQMVLKQLLKSLQAQPPRLEQSTEEERQELKLLKKEPHWEVLLLLKHSQLTVLEQNQKHLKLNLELRSLEVALKKKPNQDLSQQNKRSQQLLKFSQKLTLKPNQLKAVLKLVQLKNKNNNEQLKEHNDLNKDQFINRSLFQ